MRSVTVVCDNHHDRPAVATYSFFRLLPLGHRPLFPGLMANTVMVIDLCNECAAVLGWAELPFDPEPEADLSEPQRRLLFARFGELGFDDDARHDFLETVTGKRSMLDVRSSDVDRILEALDREAATRG